MPQIKNAKNKRMFTIELRSKDGVKNVVVDGDSKVIIEGTLGSLKRAHFVEDLVLEVVGSKGVLRVDLAIGEIRSPPRSNGGPGDGDDQ